MINAEKELARKLDKKLDKLTVNISQNNEMDETERSKANWKQIRMRNVMRTVKKKSNRSSPRTQQLDDYSQYMTMKWPYQDTYAKTLSTLSRDEAKPARTGIVLQYQLPKNSHQITEGKYNLKQLKTRKQGMKQVEQQFVKRFKTSTSPRT